MSTLQSKEKALAARLRPLYVAVFAQSFVFWYAIEKLFMKSIGYDDATIGLMVALYSGVMLAAETPSGILADRWSRKGVLLIATVFLAASALLGGLSTNVPMYLLAACAWGLFYALYSGTYESILYDAVAEAGLPGERYEHYYGRFTMVDSAALVISSVLGGLFAKWFGLPAVYFLSIPPVLVAVFALLKLREPQLHRAEVAVPLKHHIRNTFAAVMRRRSLVPVLIVLLMTLVLQTVVGDEFAQLWFIALAAPVVLLGPLNGLELSAGGIGGAIASRVPLHRFWVMMVLVLLMGAGSLTLVLSRQLAVTVVGFMVLLICAAGVEIVFTRLLHDSLTSNVRAGAASAVSTLGRLIIIPLSLVFGLISRQTDVFHASWLVVGVAVVTAVAVYKTYAHRTLPEFSAEP